MGPQAALQITESERAHRCTACGVPYATQEDDEGCPVCLLRRAMQPAATVQDQFDEGRFDHYEIVRRDDGCFLFQVTLELGANPYRGLVIAFLVLLITKQSSRQTFRSSGAFCFF